MRTQDRVPTRLTLSDGRVLAARISPGSGPALVLLHGLFDSSAGWTALCETSTRACIAFDLPGCGASDLPTRPDLNDYADDVIEGLALLGLEQVVLVGHSLGGAVAAAVVDRAPGLVGGLALLAPAGFGRVGLAEAFSLPGIRGLTERLLPRVLASPFIVGTAYRGIVSNGVPPDRAVLERVVLSAAHAAPGARCAMQAVVAAGRSAQGFHRRRLAYAGPVQLVWGTADRVIPRSHARGVLTAFPHANVEIWDGMGHHPQCERLERLSELVHAVCPAAHTVEHVADSSAARRRRSPAAAPVASAA